MMQRFREFPLRARRKAGIFKRTIIISVKQFFFGIKIAAGFALKKRNPKRVFFILGQHRTGSNLFISYLNSIPGVLFDAEILSYDETYGLMRLPMSKKEVFRHIHHSLHYRKEEVRGAKIFFVHLEQLKLSLDDLLKEFPKAQWFVLYRKNILAQYLSHVVAYKTNQWISYTELPPQVHTFEFNPDKALSYRDSIKSWYQQAMKTGGLRGRSLWMSYEELAQDPQKFFDEKVFPFLRLPQSRIHTCLVKQTLRAPSEVISNYAKVHEMIEKTDFTQNYET